MSTEKRTKWDWDLGRTRSETGSPRRHYISVFLGGFWTLLLVMLLLTTFYTVPADSVAVVQRFGKYVRTDDPGLRFKLPFGADKAHRVAVRRQLKLEFGFASSGASNPFQGSEEPDLEKAMVTGDLNEAL